MHSHILTATTTTITTTTTTTTTTITITYAGSGGYDALPVGRLWNSFPHALFCVLETGILLSPPPAPDEGGIMCECCPEGGRMPQAAHKCCFILYLYTIPSSGILQGSLCYGSM